MGIVFPRSVTSSTLLNSIRSSITELMELVAVKDYPTYTTKSDPVVKLRDVKHIIQRAMS